MKLVQQVMESFLQVADVILEEIEKGIDYPRFQLRLQEILNELGRKTCKLLLESADEQLRNNPECRKGWVIVRKDPKSILSPFGEIEYERTYFKRKKDKKHLYLVDELAGYQPHARVDAAVKANLIEHASELSYRKSGQEQAVLAKGTDVSAQTVSCTLAGFDTSKLEKMPGTKVKREVEYLYIEADEDHVPSQRGKNMEIPLVYVHEGKETGSGRTRLRNVRYFSGIYSSREDLWYEIVDYLDDHYDLEKVKCVYIAGDGAAWIKQGIKIIPKARYVMDRYHVSKSIMEASSNNDELRRDLWQGIWNGDKERTKAAFRRAIKEAETESRRETIRRCRNYILRNWEGIVIYNQDPHVLSCSAEGHVSHVLSARMSSRPMGWSRSGADKMARIRSLKANGVDLKEAYLAQRTTYHVGWLIDREELKEQKRLVCQPPYEMLENMPLLRGKKNGLADVLRSIKACRAI